MIHTAWKRCVNCLLYTSGVIAYGRTDTWSSTQISHAWMAKIDLDGNLVWKHMLNNGFDDEYIASVLENADGSYAVISRGDLKYLDVYKRQLKSVQNFACDVLPIYDHIPLYCSV